MILKTYTIPIGKTIRALKEARGMTQAQICREPDFFISRASLSAYETGIREPNLDIVVRLADYFGVSCDFLLGHTEISQTADFILGINEERQPVQQERDSSLYDVHLVNGYYADEQAQALHFRGLTKSETEAAVKMGINQCFTAVIEVNYDTASRELMKVVKV